MSGAAPVTGAARASPYKGLAPYSSDDSSFFFGRERERDVVIANLRARHLTVVYGESGVGKSSLLHAGVLSELHREAAEDLEHRETPEFMPVLFSTWRDDPVAGLLEAVRACVEKVLPGRTLIEPPEGGLTETLDAWARDLNCEFLIILDQFEEYFLYHSQEDGEGTFNVEFPQALNSTTLRASFLLAIREDTFAKLDRFKTRVPTLLDNYLRIRHLDEAAAAEVIMRPLAAWNAPLDESEWVDVEPPLVKAVIKEVRSGIRSGEQAGQGVIESDGHVEEERVEAPYLQLVMTRLWDEEMKAGSRMLRLRTLEKLGGAEQIVQNHLDEAMSALPPQERELAAAAFYYLVTPEGTKIAQSVETLAAYSKVSAKELEDVLEKLTTGAVRILRPVAPPPGTRGGTRYEIFHDVLASAILDWRARIERVKLEREREEAEHRREEAQRQERFQRRRAQRFRGLAVLFGVLFAGGLVVWGIGQQRAAARERAVRQSRELAQSAVIRIPSDPELSLLLAREALRVRHTPEAEEAFRESLMASHVHAAYRGHRDAVNSVAFSRDGKLVVTGSDDRTARVWETSTGKSRRVLRGHQDYVTSAAFSPDGKQVVTASWDKTARLWDTSSGRTVRTVRGHTRLQSAAFSPSGRLIVTAGSDHTVRIWETATGRSRAVLRGHTRSVNSAAFSADGSRIVSSSDDGTARIWQAATGATVRVLRGHSDIVWSAEFSADGRRVVTGSSDETARIWDVGTGRTVGILRGQGDVITGAAFSPDRRRVLTTGVDQAARIWDVSSRHTILVLRGHTGPVNSAAFSPKGDLVATASLDQTARLWAVPPPTPRLRHAAIINGASFRGDGKSIVTASDDGKARLWDLSRRRTTAVIRAGTGALFDAGYSPDGRSVATAGYGGARLANVDTRLVAKRFNVPGAVYSVAFSPDGHAVAFGGAGQSVRIFDPATGQQESALPAGGEKEDDVTRAVFSPDGKRVATANTDGAARVFDAASGRRVAVLRERGQLSGQIPLNDSEFSPDGKLLVTAGDYGTVKLWDLEKLGSVAILPGLSGSIYSAAFTPDGKLIVTAGQDGRVDLWDRTTARRIGMLERHDGAVLRALFDPSGERVVTSGEDGTARIVPCEVCGPIDDLLRLVPRRVTRELSTHERDLYVR